jgi:SAM-dependent methyltransferase
MTNFSDTADNKFQKADKIFKEKRKELAQALNKPDLWEIVDQFGLFAGIQTLGKAFAVFEVIKKTLHIPGHIAEFGCWHGNNLILMAKILQLLQPNTYKYIYGFDSFEGLTTFSKEDGFDDNGKSLYHAYQGDEKRLKTMLEFFDFEEWVYLIKGDALETIPRFKEENPHLRFSLAYIDFDSYKPCLEAVMFIHDRLSPGGVIAFDEALLNSWKGEGQVLNELLDRYPGLYKMENIPFARQPTAILIRN